MATEELGLIIRARDEASKAIENFSNKLHIAVRNTFTLNAASVALGSVMSNVVTSAYQSVSAAIKEGINDAMEAEVAEMRLATAMKNTGEYSEKNMQSLKNLASQLQKTTGTEDDAIIASMGLGKQLGLTNEEIEKLLPAVLDMSKGVGIDLETAMRMAARSSEGGANALSRWGIQLTEGTTEAERLDEVVTKLNEKFGGQAVAYLETNKGKMEALDTAWGNAKESAGNMVLNIGAISDAMTAATNSAELLTGAINNLFNTAKSKEQAEAEVKALKNLSKTVEEEAMKQAGVSADQVKGIEQMTEFLTKETKKQEEAKVKASEKNRELTIEELEAQIKVEEEEIASLKRQSATLDKFNAEQFDKRSEADMMVTNNKNEWTKEQLDLVNQYHADLEAEESRHLGNLIQQDQDANEIRLASTMVYADGVSSIFSSIQSSFSNILSEAVLHAETFGERMRNIWSSFATSVIQSITKVIAKLFIMKLAMSVFNLAGGTGFIAEGALAVAGSFQTPTGSMKTIPGPPGMPVPIIAHGQEIIGRPSGGAGGNINNFYGDIWDFDSAMEKVRMGLTNHGRLTGATIG